MATPLFQLLGQKTSVSDFSLSRSTSNQSIGDSIDSTFKIWMGSDYFSLVCHYFILPGLLQQPSCFHSTPYSLFSTKQPNSIFKNLSQIISLLCSKSYNDSQLTPSKSQSPYNDKQCSTGWFSSSSPPDSLQYSNTALLSVSWTRITFLLQGLWTACFTWNTLSSI